MSQWIDVFGQLYAEPSAPRKTYIESAVLRMLRLNK
jgi:hypothetical protein